MNLDRVALISLMASWLGIWGSWISHSVTSLRQNGFDLAEWATFLPEARAGLLASVPDILRLGVALIVITLVIGAHAAERHGLRWMLRLLALPVGFLLLPPYPFVLQLWNSDYGVRFLIAAAVLASLPLALVIDSLTIMVRRALMMTLAIVGLILCLWALNMLIQAFGVPYALTLIPGWGAALSAAGLFLAVIFNVLAYFQRKLPALPASQANEPIVS